MGGWDFEKGREGGGWLVVWLTCMWIWSAAGISWSGSLLWSASIHMQSEEGV